MIYLLLSVALAEPQSQNIEKGEPSPFHGRVFNDEAVAGTGFGGDFYEIIIIKEALTNTQIGNILGPLLNKYT